MAKLKVQRHKPVHPRFIDEGLIRVADDLVSSILNCDKDWMLHPTPHMEIAMWAYEDYKQELLG